MKKLIAIILVGALAWAGVNFYNSKKEEKERKASEEAKKYEGGTIAPVMHMSSLAQSTKERCYELVNKYMK